jgi:DNA-binding transcriptional LysR family regulator
LRANGVPRATTTGAQSGASGTASGVTPPISAGFADLAKERWLGCDDSCGDVAEVRWIRELGLSGSRTRSTSSTRGLVNAYAAGAGIATLPKVMRCGHSDLVQEPIAATVPPRTPWLVWRSGDLEGRRLRRAVRRVAEAFKATLQHEAPH